MKSYPFRRKPGRRRLRPRIRSAALRRDLTQIRQAFAHPDPEVRNAVVSALRSDGEPALLRLILSQLIDDWRQTPDLRRRPLEDSLRALRPASVEALKLELLTTRKPASRIQLVELLAIVSPVDDALVVSLLADMQQRAYEHATVRAAAGRALAKVQSPYPNPVES
ncbi:MAG: hypothetical protein JNM56_17155 [Planctomycetia bacterium]|nr:hypothetical protein [Planctomycetia bacterium]